MTFKRKFLFFIFLGLIVVSGYLFAIRILIDPEIIKDAKPEVQYLLTIYENFLEKTKRLSPEQLNEIIKSRTKKYDIELSGEENAH